MAKILKNLQESNAIGGRFFVPRSFDPTRTYTKE